MCCVSVLRVSSSSPCRPAQCGVLPHCCVSVLQVSGVATRSASGWAHLRSDIAPLLPFSSFSFRVMSTRLILLFSLPFSCRSDCVLCACVLYYTNGTKDGVWLRREECSLGLCPRSTCHSPCSPALRDSAARHQGPLSPPLSPPSCLLPHLLLLLLTLMRRCHCLCQCRVIALLAPLLSNLIRPRFLF